MRRVNVRKRGKVYQYRFETARVNGKRKYISKFGFKTKNVAFIAGKKDYEEYQNGRCKIEATENYYISTTEEIRKEASEKFEGTVKSETINEIIKFM